MTKIPGLDIELPGDVIASRPTSAVNAWSGEYATVLLAGDLTAMRVHVNAGEGAATRKELVAGAGLHGRWYAIGDFVQTYDEYRASHALPAHFTHAALVTLRQGTIINVGLCAPLFGQPGGAPQAEFVAGPPPIFRRIDGYWSPFSGSA